MNDEFNTPQFTLSHLLYIKNMNHYKERHPRSKKRSKWRGEIHFSEAELEVLMSEVSTNKGDLFGML